MIWGAPNTGYYAAVGTGQVNCQPQLTVKPETVTAEQERLEVNFILETALMKCKTLALGVPRPGQMAEFRGSFCRNFGGAAVEAGFIQDLLSSNRLALYGEPGKGYRFYRDGSLVGLGLLDCGTSGQPWFGGATARLTPAPPGQQGAPAVVGAGDNPRWTVPLTMHGVPLKSVVLQNSFRLFAVAKFNNTYIPICRTEWHTDIQWTPAGGLTAHVTKSASWSAPGPADNLITTGRTANMALTDKLAKL